MNKPSWDEAPEWATVLLVNKADSALYAFAEAHENGCQFKRSDGKFDEEGLNLILIESMWDYVESRPNRPNTDWQVGDIFTFNDDGDKRTISYFGKDVVCYFLEGDTENHCTMRYFLSNATPYVEKTLTQRDFEKWYEIKHGSLVWNPIMKRYEERAPNLAWEAWKEATHRYMFN